jgi:hypothetical protein
VGRERSVAALAARAEPRRLLQLLPLPVRRAQRLPRLLQLPVRLRALAQPQVQVQAARLLLAASALEGLWFHHAC